MAGGKDKSLNVPIAVIVTIIIFLVGGAFTYGINRIDKNTENIADVQKNYVTEESFNRRMDKVDDTLNRILEKR